MPFGIAVALCNGVFETKEERRPTMKTKSQIKAGADSVGLPSRKGYIR
jgi:hypothetical protein